MSIYIAHRRKSASNAFNVPSILIKKTRLQCTTKTVKNSQFACQSRLWGDLFLQIVVLQVFSCGRQFLVKFILIRPEFSHKLVKPLQVLHYALAFCHLSSWTAWTVDKVAVFFCNENWDLTLCGSRFFGAMKTGTWLCFGFFTTATCPLPDASWTS